jgi:signal transduction histidine kinase/DNA-binding response OmpR family regulator
MKNFSIKLQLTLSAIAVGFALLLAQMALQFQVLRVDITQRIEKNEYRQLSEFTKNLDERLKESVDMLASVGHNVPPEVMGRNETLEKYLQREHALLNVFDDLYIFDATGVLQVDWPMKPGRRALDMSSRDYIQAVIQTHQPVISKPLLGKATKQPIVVIAAPIFDKKNQLIGIMGGVLNLYKPNLLGSIATAKNGETGYYYLVTQDRVRIAHPDASLIFKAVPEGSINIPFEHAMQGFEGTQEGYTIKGLKGLFTFKRLQTTDWIAASVIPSEEAFAPIDALYQRMLVVTVLLMLVMMPLLWAFVSRLVSPLGALAYAMHEKAQQMQAGKQVAHIAETGSQEIKTVAKAFNAFMEARQHAENELLLARDAAQAANESKSTFLANMSHEIRTPMNGILGMTELCLQTRMTTEQRSYLEMVSVSANTLLMVINDILDFSKIEAKKLHLDPHEYSLHGLIRQTTRTLSLRASEKELELVCDLAPDVPDMVVGDPLRLQQVMNNLIGNAIKFTAHGEILLSVERIKPASVNDQICLSFRIKDTGIGISKDKQSLIFDVFTQADSSTARRFGGSGLGLAISRSLVHMMGGEISVISEVGCGSIFSFTTKLQSARVETEVRSELLASLHGKSVLVVDDMSSSRHVLVKRLGGIGLHSFAAEGAAQALHLPQLSQAAFAIVDVNMPDIDGYDVAAQLRKVKTAQEMPIIMMGALSEQVSQEQLDKQDIQGYLVKPIDVRELIMLINGLTAESTRGHRPDELPMPPSSPVITKKVLLVEDTPINQTLESILLNRMGYEVTLASNGLQSIEAFAAGKFDLILMDIQMPEMGGIEATQQIREIEQARNLTRTPIIAVTANALKGDREHYFESGMDGYVSKPLTMDSLQTEIERVIARANLFLLDC